MKILYLDDDESLSNAISTALRYRGCEIEAVNDPKVAIERAEVSDFDIFLCDHDMPIMTGTEVYSKLSEKNQKKFVLFSGGTFSSPNGNKIPKGISLDDLMTYINHYSGGAED